jgi:antitoxin VapB
MPPPSGHGPVLELPLDICHGICYLDGMDTLRHVKLFKNGRNQAVRIPREFELPGEDAVMRKEGDRLIIEPAAPRSLLALLATLPPLDEDFAPIGDLAPDDVAL